jgi:hypothetical protein
MHIRNVDHSVQVLRVQLLGLFVMFSCTLEVFIVVECASKIEVTLCTGRIQLDGELIGVDSLFVLLRHVVGISQIIEGWVMLRVEPDSLQIEVDGFHKLTLVTAGIAEVVVAFHLLGIDV